MTGLQVAQLPKPVRIDVAKPERPQPRRVDFEDAPSGPCFRVVLALRGGKAIDIEPAARDQLKSLHVARNQPRFRIGLRRRVFRHRHPDRRCVERKRVFRLESVHLVVAEEVIHA